MIYVLNTANLTFFTTIIWVHFESYIMLFCSVVWKSRCAVETRQSHIWASFIGIKAVAGRRNGRLCYSSVWLCSLRHLVYALCNGPWTEGVCVCVHIFVCMWLGSFCRNCANKLLTGYLAELLSQIMYLVIITVTFIEKKWVSFFYNSRPCSWSAGLLSELQYITLWMYNMAYLWRQAILRGHGGMMRRPELGTRWWLREPK